MIPKTLHLLWTGPPFGRGEWTSLVSALRNTTYEVVLHTDLLPTGLQYDPHALKHPRLKVIMRNFPSEVQGVLLRKANISDYHRVEILLEHGGMYADLDILWIRDVPLSETCKLASSWENPSYRTASNAWMAAEPGFEPLQGLLEQFEAALLNLKKRGFSDITGPRHQKKHLLFFYITRDFLREHCCEILPKKTFFSNGWRRLGRALKRDGISFPREQDIPDYPTKRRSCLCFGGSSGFHYFNSFFPFEAVALLPEVQEQYHGLL